MKRSETPTPDIDVHLDNLPPTVRGMACYLVHLHYPTDHIAKRDVEYVAAMSFLKLIGYTGKTKYILVRGLQGNGRKYDGTWYFADGKIIGPDGVDGNGLYAGHSHDFWNAPGSTRYERNDISMGWAGLAGLVQIWELEAGVSAQASTPYDDETPRQWPA